MPKPERHVLVCMNARPPSHPRGSCAEKGADQVLNRLKELVAERGAKDRVMVVGTRCLKHCSQGVTVAVYPDNTWYAQVCPEDAEDVVATLVDGAPPVERLQMPDIPWE